MAWEIIIKVLHVVLRILQLWCVVFSIAAMLDYFKLQRKWWVVCKEDRSYTWFTPGKIYLAQTDWMWFFTEHWVSVKHQPVSGLDNDWSPFRKQDYHRCFRKACKLDILLREKG